MSAEVSTIWRHLPPDLTARIDGCLAEACARHPGRGPAYIFFRADDVAVPGEKIARLLAVFSRRRVPLCLAVVPAWLTAPRWQSLSGLGAEARALRCWHQHGWRHVSHEKTGKKSEFGDGRQRSEIRHDLLRGRDRLEDIMGNDFFPVFTPPWNRCGPATLQLLAELGYAAVSRSGGNALSVPEGLHDFFVNVDLHTRKQLNPDAGIDDLFTELGQGISSGRCGIMIHHQMMNAGAFEFLELLIDALVKCKKIRLVDFKDLAAV